MSVCVCTYIYTYIYIDMYISAYTEMCVGSGSAVEGLVGFSLVQGLGYRPQG